jgi:hypothetical protein
MTGNGDDTVYTAWRDEPRSPSARRRVADESAAYVSPFIAIAMRMDNYWFVSVGAGLKPLRFSNHDDAVAWLTHLANLYTRPVTA